MKTPCLVLLVLWAGMAWKSTAAKIEWQPAKPAPGDAIRITIADCAQGGILHWGVNSKAHAWEPADPAYRPPGSQQDGTATRTSFAAPGSQGVCEVVLGPFNQAQKVKSVDFAIQWADGTWDSNESEDYHILIFKNRIAVSPKRPSINSPIEVTVKNSLTNGYLRWGVNANFGRWTAPHPVYWPSNSIPSDDGLALDSPLTPPDEQGISRAWLGPFNEGAQVITSLHMAAHWDREWENDFERNYQAPIALTGVDFENKLMFSEPQSGSILAGDFEVRIESGGSGPVSVWLDDRPAITLESLPYRWPVIVSNFNLGQHTLVARTVWSNHVNLATVQFWLAPPFLAGTADPPFPLGATIAEDGAVRWALYAPGKRFVCVVGDFNGWNARETPMNCSTGDIWWAVRRLDPGRQAYQYEVDGAFRLADPYSTDVDWTDAEGRETYKPELARSLLHIGAPPYPWQDANYRRPPLNQAVVYEFFIEDLCPGQGFTGVIAKLDYMKDLGVNAIEPMPFNEFAGSWSWGYNPAFHFAPETSYGTPDDLKRLIDEAHRRGMAVVMDTVLNHLDWNSPLFQLYGVDYATSPYFRLFLGDNWGFPDVNQASPAVKRYAADLLRFWVMDYHMDGFRYDATRWVEWKGYNDWGASWFAFAAKLAGSNTWQIAEHLPPDPALTRTTEMDAGWNSDFRWQLRDMLARAELDSGRMSALLDAQKAGFETAYERVNYVESHDEERVMNDLFAAGFDPSQAVRRAEAALVLTLTAPGVPMLYAGQEFGEATRKQLAPNALHWDNRNNPLYRPLFESARSLIRLRIQNEALQKDETNILINNAGEGILAYWRTGGATPVVVTVNFSRTPRSATVSLPSPALWTAVLAATKYTQAGSNLTVHLEPGQAAVFVATANAPKP